MQFNRKVRPEILDSVALLVIDAQDVFIDTLHNKESFLKRTAFAIEAARALRIQTIFTEQVPEKLGRTNASLMKLAKHPKVFAKGTFSALGAPGIERFLRDKEIYHLLVVGLEVPICIYQTGLQSTEEDIDVTFLSDALGSRRAEDEAPVLSTLIRLGCQVLPSESVFYSLLGDVQSPGFRPYNSVVKAFSASDFSLENYLQNRVDIQEAPERPERPQRQEQKNRPQPQRSGSRENEKQEEEAEESQKPSSDSSESQEERRGRRRGRRRRGRGGRDRDDRQPQNHSQNNDGKPSTPPDQKSEPSEKKADQPKPEAPKPQPKEDSAPTAQASEDKPAKKAAKKTAKKSAKKVAKKAAKKAAKKVAKKAVKKAAPQETE